MIVDADDKNCFAKLTVVLKFNQGVRQSRMCGIAGVLFFGSLFCTSKRKNINLFELALALSVLFALMQMGNPQDYEKKIKDK